MLLWDKSPRAILNVLLESTGRQFYTNEIVSLSGLSRPSVCTILRRLTDAGILIREDEGYPGETECRAARVYYSVSAEVIGYFRI